MWSDWLVFCDYGFQSVCPLMEKDKRLMETPWWERLTEQENLALMGSAMLIKSLIQFSVDGWGCVPSLLFDLRPNDGGGIEDKFDFLQKVPCSTVANSVPNPATGHRWPMPLPETPGHSQASLGQFLWSHCSFLLGPGTHKLLFVPSKSLFPVLCKFWCLWDG